jgi:hypothetical protein
MTKPLNGNQIPRSQLLRLLDTQATLLRRALITADLLRWKLIDSGYPLEKLDHPPEFKSPDGREPPEKPLPRGTRMTGFTPPQPFLVVPVTEMTDETFALHVRYRHGDRTGMTPGVHEHIHKTGKVNHAHAIGEETNGKASKQARPPVRAGKRV